MSSHATANYCQYLNEQSHYHAQSDIGYDKPLLVDLYQQMLLTRTLDDKAVRLQRTGQMGTYPSSLGQEAVGVGTGWAMHSDDVYCPYYRDQGAMLCRGVSLEAILRYWAGDERGSDYQGPKQDFPISVPIASQLLHATGAAYAIKYRQEKRAVVSMFGDGATSEGDFYEALNLAATWHLPVVFVINNNQWAISVPRSQQTATPTLAQKGVAAEIPGIQVDGNDVLAVYDTVRQAVLGARQGQGPQLIECLTYRLSDHTTADDASRYCSRQALDEAWQIEPVNRLKAYLCGKALWDEAREQEWRAQCAQHVDEAIATITSEPREPVHAMFDYLYDTFPEPLMDQYEAVWNLDN